VKGRADTHTQKKKKNAELLCNKYRMSGDRGVCSSVMAWKPPLFSPSSALISTSGVEGVKRHYNCAPGKSGVNLAIRWCGWHETHGEHL
jgi:hypothetical protein